MHTNLKLAQLRWTGYVIRLSDARLPLRKFSMKNYRRESAFKVTRNNATKTTSNKIKLRSFTSSEHINVLMRKGMGNTAVSATQASSVILYIWQHRAKEN